MNRTKCLLAFASVAIFAAPAQARDAPPPTFQGPRLEALIGTDGKVFYGGAIGYDLQRGKTVFGLDGELDLQSGHPCETLDPSINDRLCVGGRREIYVGGRIGFAVAPGALVYAKLGYTTFRERVTYDAPASAGGGFRFVDRLEGVRVGAGVEQRIGSKVYVKGEYRYSNYARGEWKHEGVVGIGIRF